MSPKPFSETPRQLLHMSMGGFALLLRVLTWQQAVALAATALVFNLLVLPRLGTGIYRPTDSRFASGIIFYPLAVLLLLLCFPARLDIVAAAWGVLAAGDGMATLVGRALPIQRLPWNRDKSFGGLLAFIVFGGGAAIALAAWTAPAVAAAPAWTFLIVAPLAAAIVAGLVETIPVGLDDNLRVPAASAIVLGSAAIVDAERVRALFAAAGPWLLPIAANAAVAIAGWLARTVTIAGAITGFTIGVATWMGAGWQGWTLLLAAFVVTVATTKVGGRRKALLGIAEERGGRRGAGNAIANTGLAAWLAALAVLSGHRDAALAGFVAALVAGSSDTVSSEIGKAYGRRTWLVTTLRAVPAGTSGAVSSEGTAAGAAAALLLAAIGASLHLIPPVLVVPVAAAAVAAAMVESVLGSTLEPRGVLNNDLLNFVTTSVAAALALTAWRMLT